mmetsp:Transcript_17032/g.56360  ORF Transcript_17032/g.56360 Transcript_17032/m.56360 type:complete len:161 (-) Transcript_17032:1970-2452(-)
MKVDQPCTPLNCQKKTYFNKITYYESRICTNQLFSNPSQLTSLLTPDATYLTTFYFSETATSCGVNNLNAIHLVGQSQCIPYMDIFTDALPSSEDYLSYTCSTRALSHCRDSTVCNFVAVYMSLTKFQVFQLLFQSDVFVDVAAVRLGDAFELVHDLLDL